MKWIAIINAAALVAYLAGMHLKMARLEKEIDDIKVLSEVKYRENRRSINALWAYHPSPGKWVPAHPAASGSGE